MPPSSLTGSFLRVPGKPSTTQSPLILCIYSGSKHGAKGVDGIIGIDMLMQMHFWVGGARHTPSSGAI